MSFKAQSLRGIRSSDMRSHQPLRWKDKLESKPEVFWREAPVIGRS